MMENLKELLQADADRLFADWGEPAVLQEVTRQFDVESGRMLESTQARKLSVIRGEDQPQLAGNMSATLSLTRRLLLVRSQELSTGVSLESARLVFDETPYEIRSVREANQAGVVVLECVCNKAGDGAS